MVHKHTLTMLHEHNAPRIEYRHSLQVGEISKVDSYCRTESSHLATEGFLNLVPPLLNSSFISFEFSAPRRSSLHEHMLLRLHPFRFLFVTPADSGLHPIHTIRLLFLLPVLNRICKFLNPVRKRRGSLTCMGVRGQNLPPRRPNIKDFNQKIFAGM
jgi:hypothetical protein